MIYIMYGDIEKRLGGLQKLRERQIAMSVSLRHGKCILDSGLDTKIGIRLDTGITGYLITGAKADAFDILGKLIRIVPDDIVHFISVMREYLPRHIDGNAVLLQKHYRILHIPF